ncbi:hypothetical protein EDD11_007852 [Mortierella claussenii]|nr:hypothetical protein EDD11_007852 [Mortierella claussenii]
MLINITGNHDIGYGYDISQARLDRWETAFGKSNFITTVDIPSKMEGERQRLHLVVLNTMLLDGPSSDETLRGQTWEFMQEASRIKIFYPKDKIVLLTHIPFHKEQGICVDAPDIRVHWDSTIIEQTMLTPNTTNWILDNIKPDFVLNGHDHHGCDVIHVLEKEGSFSSTPVAATSVNNNDGDAKGSMAAWKAYAASSTQHPPSLEKKHTIREITQRSMMAEFGGYSGLFEARIQESSQDEDKIEFHYTVCGFYTDLQVWIVLVIDLIVVVAWILTALYAAIMIFSDQSGQCSQSYTNSHGSDALDKKPKML